MKRNIERRAELYCTPQRSGKGWKNRFSGPDCAKFRWIEGEDEKVSETATKKNPFSFIPPLARRIFCKKKFAKTDSTVHRYIWIPDATCQQLFLCLGLFLKSLLAFLSGKVCK